MWDTSCVPGSPRLLAQHRTWPADSGSRPHPRGLPLPQGGARVISSRVAAQKDATRPLATVRDTYCVVKRSACCSWQDKHVARFGGRSKGTPSCVGPLGPPRPCLSHANQALARSKSRHSSDTQEATNKQSAVTESFQQTPL